MSKYRRRLAPYELLQLPGLNHSVREIRVFLSAVFCMQLQREETAVTEQNLKEELTNKNA